MPIELRTGHRICYTENNKTKFIEALTSAAENDSIDDVEIAMIHSSLELKTLTTIAQIVDIFIEKNAYNAYDYFVYVYLFPVQDMSVESVLFRIVRSFTSSSLDPKWCLALLHYYPHAAFVDTEILGRYFRYRQWPVVRRLTDIYTRHPDKMEALDIFENAFRYCFDIGRNQNMAKYLFHVMNDHMGIGAFIPRLIRSINSGTAREFAIRLTVNRTESRNALLLDIHLHTYQILQELRARTQRRNTERGKYGFTLSKKFNLPDELLRLICILAWPYNGPIYTQKNSVCCMHSLAGPKVDII